MKSLPLNVGDWIKHKFLGIVKVTKVSMYHAELMDEKGFEFADRLDRLRRAASPRSHQNTERFTETDHLQKLQTLNKISSARDFPFRFGVWYRQQDGGLICFIDINSREVIYKNPSGNHFSLPHREAIHLLSPKDKGRKTLPKWFHEEIDLHPIDTSLLAGYVVYHLESGREDGFLVHVEDEAEFLEIWAQLKRLIHQETALETVVQTALHLGRQPEFLLVSLQGVVSASIALTRHAAQYVSLKEPNVPDAVFAFLDGVTYDIDELLDQFYDTYAIIKFTEDELSAEVRCQVIFESDARAFQEAQQRLEAIKHFRGLKLRQSLAGIYHSCLVETPIDAYTWERFAVRQLTHLQDCLLLLSDCTSTK